MMKDKAAGPRVAGSLAEYLDDELSVLPDVLEASQAVGRIAALFAANGGATFNLYFGDMLDKPYHAVGIYLDREATHSVFWPGKSLSLVKLRSLMASSHQLLSDPRNSIGLWYDEDDGNTYLEVTVTVPYQDEADRGTAAELGRRYNQIGMYDLQARKYIPLGGTGKLPQDAPPVLERLPKWERGQNMSKPIETDRASARVTVAGIEPGEPPSIITVHTGTDRGGGRRHFVQQVPILDRSLFARLSDEVSEGDEITVTVINDWYETRHVTYLADFKKVPDGEQETTAKNGAVSIAQSEIKQFTHPPVRDAKTKVEH